MAEPEPELKAEPEPEVEEPKEEPRVKVVDLRVELDNIKSIFKGK